jgi:MoaA/NifB/PqqE/SkfB family radical SAM enzyme
MQYDIEADWTLLKTCNFRCTYCYLASAALAGKIKLYGTPLQWKAGFDATGRTWLIHLTGGEPTLHPAFVDLCGQLTGRHYLSINSNLSHRSVDAFAGRIDPRRVHIIHAALHDDERQAKGGRQPFIDRVHALQERHFNVLVSQVMTPQAVRRLPELAGHFRSRGLCLIPKFLRGDYQGRTYPGAYSMEEKLRIREYLAEARRNYAAVIARMGEAASINLFDDRFLDGIPSYRGRPCGAGYNFVRIDPDGTVVRCGSRTRQGNILRQTVRLSAAPRRCDTSYCPYFCEKYTSARWVGIPPRAAVAG